MGKAGGGFYAVARGRNVGVYRTWDECKREVDGFKGARYKKFGSPAEAQDFISVHSSGAASSSASSSHASRSAERPSSSRYQPYARTQTTAATTSVPRVQNRSYHGMDSGWADATVVYTDGACSNNGQRGAKAGYGVFWGPGHPDNCFGPVDGAPTNNRGELQAVAVALTQAVGKGLDKIIVRTDSMLLINSLDSWITGWKRNGWKTSSGQAVKNVELLQDIDDKRRMINVKFEHVRGHAGIEGNERADELARMGARA